MESYSKIQAVTSKQTSSTICMQARLRDLKIKQCVFTFSKNLWFFFPPPGLYSPCVPQLRLEPRTGIPGEWGEGWAGDPAGDFSFMMKVQGDNSFGQRQKAKSWASITLTMEGDRPEGVVPVGTGKCQY